MSKRQRCNSEGRIDPPLHRPRQRDVWHPKVARLVMRGPPSAPGNLPTDMLSHPQPSLHLAVEESPMHENKSCARTARHADHRHEHLRSSSASAFPTRQTQTLPQPFSINWDDPFHFVNAQGLKHEPSIAIDGISRTIITLIQPTYSLSTRVALRVFESDGGHRLDLLLKETEGHQKKFMEQLPSHLSVKAWIESMQRCGRFSDSLPIVAFALLYRLTNDPNNRICLLPSNWKALLTTAFLLAQKSIEDDSFDVIHFHTMTQHFSVGQLQQMELLFIAGIQFDLDVDKDRYAQLYRHFWLEYHTRAATPTDGTNEEGDGVLRSTACVSGLRPSARERQKSEARARHQRNQSTGAMAWRG